MSAPITYNATDEAESLLKYDAEPTIARFHMSNKLFRLITGPVGCVSADTEVMTPEGWVRIDRWADQPILEWSPDGSTEFKKPIAYIVEPCKTLIHFQGCNISMVLSAEHRVPFYNERNELGVWPAAMFRESYFYFEIPSIFGRRIRFTNTDVTISDIETADGKKYCFTTSTGFFVARHNGAVFCTGNSGKSSGCVIESFLRARSQNVWKGERRSRCLVVRSTFPELEHTTIKTFLKWFPEKDMWNRGYSMKMLWSKPFTAVLRVMLPDKTIVHAEYIFYALDKEDDAEKLKSLEVSWAYINEMRQIEQKVFKTIQERTSRWPPEDEGGLNWWGVFADTNPFDTSHYLYNTFMVDKPPEYELFRQPPAILEVKNADGRVTGYVPNTGQDPRYLAAENVKHQNSKERYWLDLTIGATRDYINVELMGNFGSTAGGKVVYPEFRTEDHVADKDIEPMRGLPIVCAYDYGLSPAIVLAQMTPRGQLIYMDEIVCGMSEKDLKGRDKLRYHGDTGIRNFATNVLKPYLINRYPGMEFIHTGDPMGSQRSPTDESTVIEELARCGIEVSQARTNKFIARKEAVEGFMMKRNGLKISPRCAMLIEGFQKQYKYRQVKKPDGEGYTTEPEKNIWSHVHDAAQYAALRMESDATTGSAIPGFGSSRNGPREVEQSGFNAYS